MHRQRSFRQHGLTGLCGPYAIVNAIALAVPGSVPAADGASLAREIAATLPVPLAAVMREGTDRAQLVAMLDAAQAITRRRRIPGWTVLQDHPVPGETTAAFWERLGAGLGPGRAAILGFGDYHRPSAYYEPHWTCLERIGEGTLHLSDSDGYDRVPLGETGIRPEPGWEIEDCFLLSRACGGS